MRNINAALNFVIIDEDMESLKMLNRPAIITGTAGVVYTERIKGNVNLRPHSVVFNGTELFRLVNNNDIVI